MTDELPDNILWHQSGVSPQGEPFVQLLRGMEVVAQLDPDGARDHARAMFMAAEAAEQDAFLLDFAREKVGMSDAESGKILVAFREYRERTTGAKGGPSSKRDWVKPKREDQ